MRKALRLILPLAAMLMATPAMAMTVNYDTNPLAPGAQPVPAPISGTVFDNVSGSLANTYLDLWDGTGCANSCPFNSVSANGSATYATGLLTSLNMIWGSPDPQDGTGERNFIAFFFNGVATGDSLDGDAVSLASGLEGTGFITVLFSNMLPFNSIVLTASRNAFEHAFSTRGFQGTPEVPLPAGLVLLLTGLMGLGFLGRSRAKAA